MSAAATFRRTPNSGDLTLADGVALTDVQPLDPSLYDADETGPMFSAKVDGETVHLFADEIILGVEYDRSRILREIDPTAYRCGLHDFIDAEGIDSDDLDGEPSV